MPTARTDTELPEAPEMILTSTTPNAAARKAIPRHPAPKIPILLIFAPMTILISNVVRPTAPQIM